MHKTSSFVEQTNDSPDLATRFMTMSLVSTTCAHLAMLRSITIFCVFSFSFAQLKAQDLEVPLSPPTVQAAPSLAVMVQPIICRDDSGDNPARKRIVERLIDETYSSANIDFHFVEPIFFDNTKARDGLIAPAQIVELAEQDGALRSPERTINMFFVNAIQGEQTGPVSVGRTPGWQVFIALAPASGQPPDDSEDAFVVAAGAAQNLGLMEAVDDPSVDESLPNLMGTGSYAERIKPLALNRSQIVTIQKSPLVRPRIECLSLEDAQLAILDDSYDGYFSKLQKLEIAALTGQVVSDSDLRACRAEARRRFEALVLPFSERETEAVEWFARQIGNRIGEEYTLFRKQPWRFIKVSDDLAGGFSHTRADCIIFSQRTIERIVQARNAPNEIVALRNMGPLFVHEQMHVFERLFPSRFATMFADFGFQREKVESNQWLDERQILNPDAVDMNWVIQDRQRNWYNLRTILRDGTNIPIMGRDFVGVAVRVKPAGDRFLTVQNANGVPDYVPLASLSDFINRLPIDNGFDHPNEIAAYLFQHVLTQDFLEGGDDDAIQLNPVYAKFRRWCSANLN